MCVVACVQTDLTADPQLQQRGAVGPVFGKPPPSAAPSQQQQIIAATRFWQTDFEPIPEDDLVMLWTRPRTTPNTRRRRPHNCNWPYTKSPQEVIVCAPRTFGKYVLRIQKKKKMLGGWTKKKCFSFFFKLFNIMSSTVVVWFMYPAFSHNPPFRSLRRTAINSVLYLNLN